MFAEQLRFGDVRFVRYWIVVLSFYYLLDWSVISKESTLRFNSNDEIMTSSRTSSRRSFVESELLCLFINVSPVFLCPSQRTPVPTLISTVTVRSWSSSGAAATRTWPLGVLLPAGAPLRYLKCLSARGLSYEPVLIKDLRSQFTPCILDLFT